MTGWTDDRKELLKKLWAEGKSATQIAKTLGGVTRNAVLSKIHRLGAAERAAPSRPATRGVRAATGKAPAPPKPTLIVKANRQVFEAAEPRPIFTPSKSDAFEPLPGSTPRPFWERPTNGCRWPIGPEALSCSEPAEGPYCPAHANLNRSPAAPKASSANELARSLRRYV